jgi:hypothetical protein
LDYFGQLTTVCEIHDMPVQPVDFCHRWIPIYLLRRYALRHVKTAVIANELALPPMVVSVVLVDLSEAERHCYNHVAARVAADAASLQVRERLSANMGSVMTWFDILRRVSIHPSLLAADRANGNNAGGNADGVNERQAIREMEPAEAAAHLAATRAPPTALEALRALIGDPPVLPECPVCLECVQLPVFLACGHLLCRECVLGVAASAARERTQGKCPFCRALLDRPKVQVLLPTMNVAPGDAATWAADVAKVGSGCASLRL